MKRLLLWLWLLMPASVALAGVGVLLPSDKDAPDPAVLSLEEMRIDVTIDNGDAHVSIVQIFANHKANIEEATYRFALPPGATVSDFAVWDGPVRIPAVILERKRAQEVYEGARLQAVDPGLLEAGERDDADPSTSAVFTAKIVPLPAYGTKRLELEYHQHLSATEFRQMFALPLKPDDGQSQIAKHLSLHFTLHSAREIAEFAASTKALPLKLEATGSHDVEGSFSGSNVRFDDDFGVTWRLPDASANKLDVITHRDPRTPLPTAGEPYGAPRAAAAEPGFFQAGLLIGAPPAPVAASSSRTVIVLFDTSLSMQWDKLERSYAALEATLRALRPADRFNVLVFNQEVSAFSPAPVAATPEAVGRALGMVRGSRLRGGTDLLKALSAALAQCSEPETTIALLTDGGSDRGETVSPARIAARYAALWRKCAHPPHTAVFAVGNDAELPLLRQLAANRGFVEPVLSTEPVEFHLRSWLGKLTHDPLSSVELTAAAPAGGISLVYPLDEAPYPGSLVEWVGQYRASTASATFTAHGSRAGVPLAATATVALPAVEPAHPQLPRLWAQARVTALLAQIDSDGEDAAAIAEIISLSRRYKFVTPYTSFLAVPRALLRPRVIRPGDPLLRVRTNPAITSVIAMFPFGLTKPLRHLSSEDLKTPGGGGNRLWETRFLAPPGMRDGTYNVRLLLRDTGGQTYSENKTFVIASTPPTVRVQLPRRVLHRGELLEVRALASASTRTLTAHIDGAATATLRWDPKAGANTGVLSLPAGMPVGRYKLTVTAEDIAHNLGSGEVPVDVVP